VLVRRFFVISHEHRYVVGLPVAAAVLLVVLAFVIRPQPYPRVVIVTERASPAVSYAQVGPIVAQRCAVCHAARPTQPGIAAAPAGGLLDTPQRVRANAARVASHAMPLGNVTHMTAAERATLGAWISAGAKI
jgi:uncharacterized membrane protein